MMTDHTFNESFRSSAPSTPPAVGSNHDAPIKPNLFCHSHSNERADDVDDFSIAPYTLLPRLKREEYYTNPSIEAMGRMSEAKLSAIDNLEVGRYGYGCVRWPGLTDVRRLDFDTMITIDRGSLTLYPDQDKPKAGEELNKEAIVTLHVRPSRNEAKLKSAEALRARLAKHSEDFGGKFISYDMDKWIFRVPNFDGQQLNNG